MREAMGFFINRPQNQFTDQKADDIAYYLNRMFGEDSALPKSPADLPAYKETVHKFSDEALKIVYVEYETPGPNRMPWSAYPDQDGKFWIPYYGRANKIGQLDPVTRRDHRVPGAGDRDGGDPFGGAGARRHRLADRAGLQQARQMGSQDPEDHRVSGRLGQAHACGSTPTARCGRPAA